MVQGGGRLARRVLAMREKSGAELSAMFGAWVELGEDFGAPRRRRLFFPLTGVLAVSLAGALGGSRLPGDAAQVPGMAGLGGKERLGPHGGLLQGPRAASPGGPG